MPHDNNIPDVYVISPMNNAPFAFPRGVMNRRETVRQEPLLFVFLCTSKAWEEYIYIFIYESLSQPKAFNI